MQAPARCSTRKDRRENIRVTGVSLRKTADTIAIYSRKSRYTGKGESIGKQIDLCREYIRTPYGDAAASAIFPA